MLSHDEKPFKDFDSFDEAFDQAESRPGYWVERAKLEFTREVLAAMAKCGMSRTELAERLGVRPGMVTRLLTGKNNFELATMVRLAFALKCRFRSHLHPIEHDSMWIDVLKEDCPRHANIIPWNPDEFKSVEVRESSQELSHVPIAVNSR